MKENQFLVDMPNMILSHILTGHKFIHFSVLWRSDNAILLYFQGLWK